MKKRVHASAGATALLTISMFWVATVASKFLGSTEQIIWVKTSILWGMLLLVPAMAITGASGFSLGGKWKNPMIRKKKARMKFAGGNGVLILIPSAFFLAAKAQVQDFDTSFLIVQSIELVAGATNILLLSLNARDGLQLSRRTNLSV